MGWLEGWDCWPGVMAGRVGWLEGNEVKNVLESTQLHKAYLGYLRGYVGCNKSAL